MSVDPLGPRPQEPYFYTTPQILLAPDRLGEFYPSRKLSRPRALNAIARLVLYALLIYFLTTGNWTLPLITLVLVLFWGRSIGEGFDQKYSDLAYGFNACCNNPSYNPEEREVTQHCTLQDRFPDKVGPTCGNPFMNPTVNDFMTKVDRAPAMPHSDPEVNQKVNDLYEERLYLDIDDLWQKRNGQREFYTNPNTQIPNDQEGFARFLFDNPNHGCRESYICKNDLRFNHSGPGRECPSTKRFDRFAI